MFVRKSMEQLRRDLARIVAPYPDAESLRHHLQRLIRRLGINVVLDVGAHVGQYAHLLRVDVGFTGHIVSFEPCAASYERLTDARRGDLSWRGHQYALGSAAGDYDINVYAAATNLSSFLLPSAYGEGRFPDMAGARRLERVSVHRLADVFDEVTAHVPKRRVMLKMDCQGFDLEVLEGAKEVLNHIVAVQTELSAMPIYDRMPSLTTTLSWLERAGYQPTGMFPVTCDRDDLRVIEFDCLCIREPETGGPSS
jgi:FkbM family methyltransferase